MFRRARKSARGVDDPAPLQGPPTQPNALHPVPAPLDELPELSVVHLHDAAVAGRGLLRAPQHRLGLRDGRGQQRCAYPLGMQRGLRRRPASRLGLKLALKGVDVVGGPLAVPACRLPASAPGC